MDTKEAEIIAEKLREQSKDMRFPEGATEDQIAEFERENDITLPVKLKAWLSYADGGDFFIPSGPQIYGVSHKPFIDADFPDLSNFPERRKRKCMGYTIIRLRWCLLLGYLYLKQTNVCVDVFLSRKHFGDGEGHE